LWSLNDRWLGSNTGFRACAKINPAGVSQCHSPLCSEAERGANTEHSNKLPGSEIRGNRPASRVITCFTPEGFRLVGISYPPFRDASRGAITFGRPSRASKWPFSHLLQSVWDEILSACLMPGYGFRIDRARYRLQPAQ